jgi:hypothetical protein
MGFLLKLALGGLNILKLIGGWIAAFFKALNLQGWIGLAGCLLLAYFWIGQRGEARHWHKQSDRFEALYRAEQAAFAQTVANYRAAAERARAADAANQRRVEGEQAQINQRSSHDFQTRLADARARYAAGVQRNPQGAADRGGRGAAPVPGLPAAAGGPAQAAGQDGLSTQDQLTATEQAIQLDELIKWVQRQHSVDVNGPSP